MADVVLKQSSRDCARLRGRSAASCWCKLPNERGWAPCPPEAQGVRTVPMVTACVTPQLIEQKPVTDTALKSLARMGGYTGNACTHCDSMRMRINGTCEVCDDCGETGACG